MVTCFLRFPGSFSPHHFDVIFFVLHLSLDYLIPLPVVFLFVCSFFFFFVLVLSTTAVLESNPGGSTLRVHGARTAPSPTDLPQAPGPTHSQSGSTPPRFSCHSQTAWLIFQWIALCWLYCDSPAFSLINTTHVLWLLPVYPP